MKEKMSRRDRIEDIGGWLMFLSIPLMMILFGCYGGVMYSPSTNVTLESMSELFKISIISIIIGVVLLIFIIKGIRSA